MKRRQFLSAAAAFAPLASLAQSGRYKISLAQWSLHRAIRARMMTNLDFPKIAREQFGIDGLEFVNALWEAPTLDYVRRLKNNMKSTATTAVLIMCDGEGFMGAPAKEERMRAAEAHFKWVDITAELGGHAIRTNMYPGEKQPSTPGEIDDFINRCAESFTRLCEYAKARNINVIIENHGGVSSNPDVVVRLMKKLSLPNFGTLPDFGNFPKEIDRYDAVQKLMAFAKGVSFKAYHFDASGKETTFDCDRLMKIVGDAGYKGWIGIEFEGEKMTEFEGIQASKRFLQKYL